MSFDLSTLEADFLYRMGTDAWANSSWLTQAELYHYFDEGARRLALALRVFVFRDTSVALVANVAQYAQPAGAIALVHASVSDARLRPASVDELAALDATWQTTPCAPGRKPALYSSDAGPLGTVTVYPLPEAANAGATLAQIFQGFPPGIAATQTIVPLPAPAADHLAYYAAGRARGKESEGAMPEMAAHFEARVKLYEQVLASYWGETA